MLLALTGFAVTEPLLSIFGADLTIFFNNDITGFGQVVFYALCVALVPAFALWSTTVVVSFFSVKVSILVHYLIVGLLAALWIIQLVKWTLGIDRPEVLVLAALFGACFFLLAYLKWPSVHSLLEIASIAPLIFVALFLFVSEVSALLRMTAFTHGEEPGDSGVGSSQNAPSVLFLLFDEFPTLSLLDEDGSIDRDRFPKFAQLSDQATWYRHYTVLSDITNLSVPAILTGSEPTATVATFVNMPRNLFSLLAPTHHLTAFEGVTRLCGLPQCSVGPPGTPIVIASPKFGQLFSKSGELWIKRISLKKTQESALDDFAERLSETTKKNALDSEQIVRMMHTPKAADVMVQKPERVINFLETFSNSGPALYYLHLLLPHIPWMFYEDGGMYRMPRTRPLFSDFNNDGGEWLAKISEYRFLMQAKYTDSLLGELVGRLKSLDMWDDMLVVVTSDHGRSFKPMTSARHLQTENIDSIAYAPLFIKRPGQEQGLIDDSNLMPYDVLPTIANILDIQVPWEAPGFPAGHEGIAKRGDRKVIFPQRKEAGELALILGEKIEFSDSTHFPSYTSRSIASRENFQDPLMLLNGDLGLQEYMGKSPENFTVTPGGSAIVDELTALITPAANKPKLGAIMGNLEFEPAGEKVLVSVNGYFVSASPLISFGDVDNTFIAFLPQNALGRNNDIGVFLVEDRGLVELNIRQE